MTTYRRLVENNEHEGATWSFWLQVDGNERQIADLDDLLGELEVSEDDFTVTDDVLTEPEVDLLVRFADENYMLTHNKVSGAMVIPKIARADAEAMERALYKGGIKHWFAGGAE